MPTTLAKYGIESMLVEIFKELNLEEIRWCADSRDFVRRFKFSFLFLIIFNF